MFSSKTHFFYKLTLCEVTVRTQEYKIMKNAILQKRLLSEKRSTFAYYNPTQSEIFRLTDHEKQSKSLWPTEKFAKNRLKEKSSGPMRI